MTDIKFQLSSARRDLDKVEEKFEELKNQVAKLSNPAGEFKKYESYPQAPNLKRAHGWGYSRDEFLPKGIAEKELGAWFTKCTAICERNKEVENHNSIIFDKAVAFMLSLGLGKTETYKKTSRSVNWSTRESPWLTSIRNQKGSGGGWSRVNDQCTRLSKGIVEREEAKAQAEKQKEKERKAAIAERQSNLKIALIAQKYVPENAVECENDEILEAILGRCKYLCLAHWMRKNRDDWNDGYSYAEIGLNQFTIESVLDQEIDEDISDLIQNWDNDGRVFRDCTHSYDTLFARCDEELLKDYNAFIEMFPGDC